MKYSDDTIHSEESLNTARRMIVLLVLLALSTMPLIWLSVDQRAADKLLYLSKMAPW